jgi:hypothetical protein
MKTVASNLEKNSEPAMNAATQVTQYCFRPREEMQISERYYEPCENVASDTKNSG